MGCEKLIVLMLVCLVNEMASEPRFRLGGLLWGRRRRYCHKTNCVLGSWSSWSSCSHSCGPHGTQYSHRSIIKPAKCGGTCSVTTQARACNRFCLNGGTLIRSSCHCKYGYSGVCCEKGHGEFLNDSVAFISEREGGMSRILNHCLELQWILAVSFTLGI